MGLPQVDALQTWYKCGTRRRQDRCRPLAGTHKLARPAVEALGGYGLHSWSLAMASQQGRSRPRNAQAPPTCSLTAPATAEAARARQRQPRIADAPAVETTLLEAIYVGARPRLRDHATASEALAQHGGTSEAGPHV